MKEALGSARQVVCRDNRGHSTCEHAVCLVFAGAAPLSRSVRRCQCDNEGR